MLERINANLLKYYHKYLNDSELFDMSVILSDFLVSNYSYIENSNYQNYISINDVFGLCEAYLSNLNYKYIKIFNDCLNNGIIDINFDDQKNNINLCNFLNDKQNIAISARNNISDVFNLCHEFMHYLNLDEQLSSARYYFSECISMLAEYDLEKYLEKNNYNNYEFKKFKQNRFSDSYLCAMQVLTINELFKYCKNKEQIDDAKLLSIYNTLNNNYPNIQLNYEYYQDMLNYIFDDHNMNYVYQSSSHIFGFFMSQYMFNNFKSSSLINYYNENINKMDYQYLLEEIGLNLQIKDNKMILSDPSCKLLFKSFNNNFHDYNQKMEIYK